jgi:hypothetical protein
MATQTVTIQGAQYVIPAPYAAGHVLTEVEAAVLNQTFAENVRNNMAARMKAAAEKNEPIPGEAEVREYAKSYSFGIRQPRGESADPVETEFRRMARQVVLDALRAKNKSLKDVIAASGDEEADKAAREQWMDAAIESVRTRRPDVFDSAKAVVEARKSVRTAPLDIGL